MSNKWQLHYDKKEVEEEQGPEEVECERKADQMAPFPES